MTTATTPRLVTSNVSPSIAPAPIPKSPQSIPLSPFDVESTLRAATMPSVPTVPKPRECTVTYRSTTSGAVAELGSWVAA